MRAIDADPFWKAMTTRFDSCADLGEIMDVLDSMPTLSPDDVRGVGEWEDAGKQMLINLENAREQYSVLGYPHRTESKRRCSVCRKITLVDASIEYKYCPHCGARMKGAEDKS